MMRRFRHAPRADRITTIGQMTREAPRWFHITCNTIGYRNRAARAAVLQSITAQRQAIQANRPRSCTALGNTVTCYSGLRETQEEGNSAHIAGITGSSPVPSTIEIKYLADFHTSSPWYKHTGIDHR